VLTVVASPLITTGSGFELFTFDATDEVVDDAVDDVLDPADWITSADFFLAAFATDSAFFVTDFLSLSRAI